MIDREQLIVELRNQFKDGATPAALIRWLMDELGESATHAEVCAILERAFHLPVVRLGLSILPKDASVLNRWHLMEIIEHRAEWDDGGSATWMDGLVVEDPVEVRRRLDGSRPNEISQASWEKLEPRERESLLTTVASAEVISQRLSVLCRLAERLQEKIAESTAIAVTH
jgi:hypothetical protein